MYIKARCKINLTINVLNKRDDGYHELESVFQPISLYDELYIEKIQSDEFKFECDIDVLNNENNIICKAYRLMKQKYPNKISGVKARLIKHIPTEAGLGGGSADCASFIKAIDQIFNLELSQDDLISIGKTLGADVPACMFNNAIIGEGIGEKITSINTKMKYYILVVKPYICCNTKQMFEKLDETGSPTKREATLNVIKALETNDIKKLSENLYNSFENAIDEESIIFKIKDEFLKNNACGTLMSGSGSSVYGIYSNKQDLKNAYENMKNKYKVFFCMPINR